MYILSPQNKKETFGKVEIFSPFGLPKTKIETSTKIGLFAVFK